MPRPKRNAPHPAAMQRAWITLRVEGIVLHTSNPVLREIATAPMSPAAVEQLASRLGWPATFGGHGWKLAAPENVTIFGRYDAVTDADGRAVREVARDDGSTAMLPASSPAVAAMVAA